VHTSQVAPRTTAPPSLTIDDLSVLLPSWRMHLRARNLAAGTISSYMTVGTTLLDWLREQGMPTAVTAVHREHLEAFLASLSERVSAATVAKHYRSMQQLFRFLVDDGELTINPMERMRAPVVPVQPPDVFADEEVERLVATTKGQSFENRRDAALIRFLDDTGGRAAELIGLTLEDIDHNIAVAHVLGKGRRRRAVPYGPKTADALRRYLRARTQHPQAALPYLWLGKKGKLTESGLRQMLERRGKDAGVSNVYPHRFRHTFAHNWLLNGGQEQDLMRLAGWNSPQMVGRYGASAAQERALEAHRRMNLGNRL